LEAFENLKREKVKIVKRRSNLEKRRGEERRLGD
jgi:hypothetical protein